MSINGNDYESQQAATEVGRRLLRLVAWLAVAAVLLIGIALCVFVVYLILSG